jgi:hypothetical protein
VSHSDEDDLFFSLFHLFDDALELVVGVDRMVGGTDGDRMLTEMPVPVAESGGGVEVELGARGVDQIVVTELLGLPLLALAGVLDGM